MPVPRITIVTPSYNQGRYLEATMRSVLDQGYPDLEYIVIDGGSTDESVDVIRRHAGRLAYWVSEPDGGQSAAIGKGFARATGDVLAWLNSDDLYAPGALEAVARVFEAEPGVDFVYGARRIIDAEGRAVGRYEPPTLLHKYYFSFGQWIPQECAFWRRGLYERAGGMDPARRFAMDFSLFTRMWDLGRFKRLDAELGAFRVHEAAKTSTMHELMSVEGPAVRASRGIPQISSRRLHRAGERLIHLQADLEVGARRAVGAARALARAGRGLFAAAALALAVAASACDAGVAVTGAPEAGVGATPACHAFPMPNAASTGLPHPASYTTLADGTVRDELTGLVWQTALDANAFAHADAIGKCAAMGDGWRLPTRLELLSLVDFTVPAPGPTINAVFPSTPNAVFWTSSLYAGDLGDAWTIAFDVGYSDYGVRDASDLVRCVRAPEPDCAPERTVVQGGGQSGESVYDHTTDLTWQRTLDPGAYTWDDAQTYCKGLGAGWRVPSIGELQTIVDDAKEDPATDLVSFPDTPSVDFWSSTAQAGTPGTAWYVDFFYGATDRDVDSRLFRVRCVR